MQHQSSTSPALVGIHPNPGPKTGGRGKRKVKSQTLDPISPEPKKAKRSPSHKLTTQERDEIKQMLLEGKSVECIIKEKHFSKKVVERWSKRFRETGDVKHLPPPNKI